MPPHGTRNVLPSGMMIVEFQPTKSRTEMHWSRETHVLCHFEITHARQPDNINDSTLQVGFTSAEDLSWNAQL